MTLPKERRAQLSAWVSTLRGQGRSVLVVLACALGFALLPLLGERTIDGRTLSWTSLLPTTVTLAAALLSGRIALSLGLGVVVGSVLEFGAGAALPAGIERYLFANLFDPWHLYISAFALLTLGMVKLTELSGAIAALVGLLGKRLASARSTKLATFGAGLVVFFDDYASTFLVGSCMRPLTDRNRVSREKLAHIVDSTAAPVAGLVIVSTWLSYELGVIASSTEGLSLGRESYALLIAALPLRFYCIFALGLVLLSCLWERELGPMVQAEARARAVSLKADPMHGAEQVTPEWRTALGAVLPISVLAFGMFLGVLLDGGGLADPVGLLQPWRWGQWLISARHVQIVLFSAAAAASVVAWAWALGVRRLPAARVASWFARGVQSGGSALLVLFGAWALGDVSKDLGAGAYLVATLHGAFPSELLSLLTFLVAAGIAFATGTSFGTMAILLPPVLPLAHAMGGEALMILALAAVLDGAIFGDHCSPVSDTTLLSSTACECDVLAHVKTQLPYALLAMGAAALATASVSWSGASPLLCHALGLLLLALALRAFGRPLAPVANAALPAAAKGQAADAQGQKKRRG